MVAGTNMFVEQAGNGLGISYLTALAGGAGTGSGGAGTGIGGEGTGTGGAGTGSGGSQTPEESTGDSTPGVMASGFILSANLGSPFKYYNIVPPPPFSTKFFLSGVYSANTDFKPAFDGSFDSVYVGPGFNLTITSSSGQLLLSVNGTKIVNNVIFINASKIPIGTSIIKAYWSSVSWYDPANGLAGAPAGQVFTVSRGSRTEFGVGVPNQYG